MYGSARGALGNRRPYRDSLSPRWEGRLSCRLLSCAAMRFGGRRVYSGDSVPPAPPIGGKKAAACLFK